MQDAGLVHYADPPRTYAAVSYDEPPRTFDKAPRAHGRYRMSASSLLRRNEIVMEPLSCVSTGSLANSVQALSREIDNSWSVSSSVIDIISQYESLINATLRVARVQEDKASENVFEIKRLTGYSWSKVAELVGVDRRSITSWVGGGAIKEKNAHTIAKALETLRFIDRGNAEYNRKALETMVSGGRKAFDDLVDGRHVEVRAALGAGSGRFSFASRASEVGTTETSLGREMLMHPEADPYETNIVPDDTPPPKMRRVTAKRM
jgi:hypothetical protein